MLFFRPPPAPPAVDASASFYLPAGIVSLVALTLLLILLAVLHARRNWAAWLDVAIVRAFAWCDIDGSGQIEYDELHSGVLRMYLEINLKGIRCKAPSMATIDGIVQALDTDNDRALSLVEFRQVAMVLSHNLLARSCTQIAFKIAAPVVASVTWRALRRSASTVVLVPEALSSMLASVPSTLPATLLSVVIVNLIVPSLLDWMDAHAAADTRRRSDGLQRRHSNVKELAKSFDKRQ